MELYHDIFGSILDRNALTPYLLRGCTTYEQSMRGASAMMGNRGFIVDNGVLSACEKERAARYVTQAFSFMTENLFPSVRTQLVQLSCLDTPDRQFYIDTVQSLDELSSLFVSSPFRTLADSDPRHLFLLASSAKYPHLFEGYEKGPRRVPPVWRLAGCSVLKMCHIIKAIEEDSQDIYDYACLGMFFAERKYQLNGLSSFGWTDQNVFPSDDNARRAFVKCAAFFKKLSSSVTYGSADAADTAKNTGEKKAQMFFNSGDGISVPLADIKARLKSPASMFIKIGKDAAEEAYNIRDILAVTFILEHRDDSLALFHALQKQGVILQENTSSTSITQTLYSNPSEMHNAVVRLMDILAAREGIDAASLRARSQYKSEAAENAELFFKALSYNAHENKDSSDGHRKFQCKIKFSVPVRYDCVSGRVLSDTEAESSPYTVRQHTLPVELRISDRESWIQSELKGEAHHSAYKFRQLTVLMNRLFKPLFYFPTEKIDALRRDQALLFK